ncbi:MAG: cyanophycinase [Flavisolibacter sp.]|nr:cyanophycinase [Flavisolibacter sp.]MBD0365853.1 cyanophycinase [Flavisolibacter sp.]MBD0375569.1 cyanophycinase [Flavisolibacter sp.]
MAKKSNQKRRQTAKDITYTKGANDCPSPSGTLMLIGGKESKEADPEDEIRDKNKQPLEVLKTFLDTIGKKNPTIELVTTASTGGEESYRDYKKVFSELGVENIGHIHHTERKQILEDNLEERIKNADAFFFAGGDQLKYTSIYGGSLFLTLLKERYINDKIVIAGTSAGAMALSTPMIYAGNEEVHEITGEIKITTGLEFLKDVCVDTHFVNRGRFVRMAQVIVTNPTCIGLGIDENTALIVRNGLEAEVVGSGIIIVIDGFHIATSNIVDFAEKNAMSIRDLKVHMLVRGDKYNIPQANPPHK